MLNALSQLVVKANVAHIVTAGSYRDYRFHELCNILQLSFGVDALACMTMQLLMHICSISEKMHCCAANYKFIVAATLKQRHLGFSCKQLIFKILYISVRP